jgi:hypothetical protein
LKISPSTFSNPKRRIRMSKLRTHSSSCEITLDDISLDVFYTYTASKDSEELFIDEVYLKDPKADIYALFYTDIKDIEEEVYSSLGDLNPDDSPYDCFNDYNLDEED